MRRPNSETDDSGVKEAVERGKQRSRSSRESGEKYDKNRQKRKVKKHKEMTRTLAIQMEYRRIPRRMTLVSSDPDENPKKPRRMKSKQNVQIHPRQNYRF